MFWRRGSWWRRRGSWWRRRGAGALLLLLLLAALCALRLAAVTVTQHRRDAFPRHRPAALAHLLADFNYHTRLYPHIGSWSLVSESGNYTWWRYEVQFACGARCRGGASLAAHERVAGHGRASSHRLLLAHRTCTAAPLLHWPSFCDEWWTDTVVTAGRAGEGGALVTEQARAQCSLLGAATGACARALAAARELHARRLTALLLQLHDSRAEMIPHDYDL